MNRQTESIPVWDPLLRSFHWLLVAAFAAAWWSEGRDIAIHMVAGSMIPGLLLFRIIWGFAGEGHALFAAFRPSLADIRGHLRALLRLQGTEHIGHTPIGSLMIYALLVSLFLLSLSGMLLMALQMGIGPFHAWAAGASSDTEWFVMQVHHACFEVLQILVAVHLAGVLAESLLQRINLTTAMISGRKQRKEVQP